MGLNFLASSSTYDKPKQRVTAPNPDPKKCEIRNHRQFGEYLLVHVKYVGCNTFEGSKILVYLGVSIDSLQEQLKTVGLDPHFSANILYYSPIARFRPDIIGFELAVKFCETCRSF